MDKGEDEVDLDNLTGNDDPGSPEPAKYKTKIPSKPLRKKPQPRQMNRCPIPTSFEKAEMGDRWILAMHQEKASVTDMCKVWEHLMFSSITPNNLNVRLHRMEASFMEVRAHHVSMLGL